MQAVHHGRAILFRLDSSSSAHNRRAQPARRRGCCCRHRARRARCARCAAWQRGRRAALVVQADAVDVKEAGVGACKLPLAALDGLRRQGVVAGSGAGASQLTSCKGE